MLVLPLFLAGCLHRGEKAPENNYQFSYGAIIRGDNAKKQLSLVFTGDGYADGGHLILSILKKQQVSASFFLTGKFYRNPLFEPLIQALVASGHYMGAHSDQHLLYCSWDHRDSLLLNRTEFYEDLQRNYQAMKQFGIHQEQASYFLPPYEWYNDTIAAWTRSMNRQLINFTPGTWSHADYTLPGTPEYRSSAAIFNSILAYEQNHTGGLNGFILLSHIGTAPERTDKFYFLLDSLIGELHARGYQFRTIDQLLPLDD